MARGCVMVAALVVAAVLAPAGPVRAGNDDELLIGNRASLTGGAVVATVEDGSSTWHNPAGLGVARRSSVSASASAYTLRTFEADGFIRAVGGAHQGASVSEFVVAPTQITSVSRLAPGVALGLGYFAPRATDLVLREYLRDERPGLESDWSLTATIATSEQVFGMAVGWGAATGLRLGCGLLAVYEDVTEAADLYGSVATAGQPTSARTVNGLAIGTTLGLEAAAGARLELGPRWVIGIALRSPRVRVLESALVTDALVASSTGTAPATLTADFERDDRNKNPFDFLRAGRYRAGIAYRLADGFVALDADVQPGIGEVDDRERRRFTWNARFGFMHHVDGPVSFGAGLFTDRAARVLDPDGLVQASGHFYGGSAGIELSNEHDLASYEEADNLVFSTTIALRYATSVADAHLLQVDPEAGVDGFFTPVDGEITSHEIGLYVGSTLYF